MFRHPTLSSEEYLSLYEKLPETIWGDGGSSRQDFSIIYSCLASHAGGSILDVGCYAGIFLTGLSERFKKYGLEPSEAASICAVSKGINVVGKTLNDLDQNLEFDVITSIDVIEHLLNIEEFLSQAMLHVKVNGLLIIATGDPDATFWKTVFKSRYWYNVFPEHVSFPSYKYFCDYAEKSKLPSPEKIRFRYMELNYFSQFSKLLQQLGLYLSPSIYRGLRKFIRVVINRTLLIPRDVPVLAAGAFIDHHIIIFRKKE